MKKETLEVFIAFDSKIFRTQKECEIYEKTTFDNIKSQLKLVSTNIENDIFEDVGSDEYIYDVYRIENASDIVNMRKFYSMSEVTGVPDKLEESLIIGELIIIGHPKDEEMCIYCYGTVKNYMQNIANKFLGL